MAFLGQPLSCVFLWQLPHSFRDPDHAEGLAATYIASILSGSFSLSVSHKAPCGEIVR